MARDFDRATVPSRYPHVVYAEFPSRTQAHVLGTGLRVWQIVKTYRALREDVSATADYFEIEPSLIEEALRYSIDHPSEIAALLARHDAFLTQRSVDVPGEEGQQPSERI